MARKDEEIYALRQRVKKLESQVTFLLDHLRLEYPGESAPGINEEIIELVRMGRKIDAIRFYREETGVGLKEAKEFIDSL